MSETNCSTNKYYETCKVGKFVRSYKEAFPEAPDIPLPSSNNVNALDIKSIIKVLDGAVRYWSSGSNKIRITQKDPRYASSGSIIKATDWQIIENILKVFADNNIHDVIFPEDQKVTTENILSRDFIDNVSEAYRQIINTCKCDSDCSCNAVCQCNINCGCDYASSDGTNSAGIGRNSDGGSC